MLIALNGNANAKGGCVALATGQARQHERADEGNHKASDGGDWEFVMNRVFDGREQTIGVNTHDLALQDTAPGSDGVSRS